MNEKIRVVLSFWDYGALDKECYGALDLDYHYLNMSQVRLNNTFGEIDDFLENRLATFIYVI